jgi:hypothetical protein
MRKTRGYIHQISDCYKFSFQQANPETLEAAPGSLLQIGGDLIADLQVNIVESQVGMTGILSSMYFTIHISILSSLILLCILM